MKSRVDSIRPDVCESESYIMYLKGRDEMDAGRLEAAVELFCASMSMEKHPKTAELLGECQLRLGRVDEAVTSLATAVEIGRAARAPLLLARAHLQKGDHDAATRAVKRSLKFNSRYKPALDFLREIENSATKEISV